ncbi:hypothetical protein BOH78_4228 [Pichia kudriavzevii]|uniref:Thiamine-binding protein domain-containing protein n=1 Tax=Pichia kudriavzevii TaxID=4909 RepID=A0A1V2LK82_PICKU|nr:hypothetical protein BOH78_4228 [Pichia kudriavzevii]
MVIPLKPQAEPSISEVQKSQSISLQEFDELLLNRIIQLGADKMHLATILARSPKSPTNIYSQIGPIDSIEKALKLAKPLLEASGQEYVIHDGGFTIDAKWKDAMTLVGQIHEHLHKSGFVRVHSDMRVGTRTDKAQTMQDKINVVEKKLKQ